MGFSNEWDQRFLENTHLSIWPWSDLVSFVNRHAKPNEDFNSVLELGCGAGANIPFFLSRKNEYRALEGSKAIVKKLINKYPDLKNKIVCADFTKEIPFDEKFDMVIDRASITHNDTTSIKNCLELINEKLRINGIFVGIDWFSKKHIDAKKGKIVDKYTRREIDTSTFKDVGNVHFSDREHLEEIFTNAGFKIEVLEHKIIEVLIGKDMRKHGTFNLIAKKR